MTVVCPGPPLNAGVLSYSLLCSLLVSVCQKSTFPTVQVMMKLSLDMWAPRLRTWLLGAAAHGYRKHHCVPCLHLDQEPGSFVLYLMSQLVCPLSSLFWLLCASVSSSKELKVCMKSAAVRGSQCGPH